MRWLQAIVVLLLAADACVAQSMARIVNRATDTTCVGSNYFLTIHFAGTPPFGVVVSDGVNTFQKQNIAENTFTFNLAPNAQSTVYTIASASDASGSISPLGNVQLFLQPCRGLPPRQDHIWYFGYNAAVEFSSGRAVGIRAPHRLDAFEGVSTISAPYNGPVLFYTDGQTIWNAQHTVMQNGNGLLGNFSAAQGAFILPIPMQQNKYYVFVMGAGSYVSGQHGGLSYSVVDMSDGVGAVTEKNTVIQERTLEMFTTVVHCDGTSIWVIVHDMDLPQYHAYLITPFGINTQPVVSIAGGPLTHFSPSMMKASPNGDLLASTVTTGEYVYVMKFNNSTGQIALGSVIKIRVPDNQEPYGLSFSPDNSKLYITTNVSYSNMDNEMSMLLQADVSVFEENVVQQSLTTIYQSDQFKGFGTLQLGPDKRLYAVEYEGSSLSVVNEPNQIGTASDFQFRAIPHFGSGRYGLPHYLDGYNNSVLAQVDATASKDTVCARHPVQLSVTGAASGSEIHWFPCRDLISPDSSVATAALDSTTTFYVSVREPGSCVVYDSVTIVVIDTCCSQRTTINASVSTTSDILSPADATRVGVDVLCDSLMFTSVNVHIQIDHRLFFVYSDSSMCIAPTDWSVEITKDSAGIWLHSTGSATQNLQLEFVGLRLLSFASSEQQEISLDTVILDKVSQTCISQTNLPATGVLLLGPNCAGLTRLVSITDPISLAGAEIYNSLGQRVQTTESSGVYFLVWRTDSQFYLARIFNP